MKAAPQEERWYDVVVSGGKYDRWSVHTLFGTEQEVIETARRRTRRKHPRFRAIRRISDDV